MKYGLISLALVFALNGCEQQGDSTSVTANPPAIATSIPTHDSSQTSLDWPGTYVGTLPCASCSGIATELTLNAELQFMLTSTYLDEASAPFVETGHFSWDSLGGRISLTNGQHYLVGENQLFLLNADGERVTGDLADAYRLHKQANKLGIAQ